mmetsp:Transcript_6884/g.22696  ORF Transcript_6884/g.22696 Transcript_6884/m.22696 type:complete len:207 (-) Transcript_6884:8-628(-)
MSAFAPLCLVPLLVHVAHADQDGAPLVPEPHLAAGAGPGLPLLPLHDLRAVRREVADAPERALLVVRLPQVGDGCGRRADGLVDLLVVLLRRHGEGRAELGAVLGPHLPEGRVGDGLLLEEHDLVALAVDLVVQLPEEARQRARVEELAEVDGRLRLGRARRVVGGTATPGRGGRRLHRRGLPGTGRCGSSKRAILMNFWAQGGAA